MDAKTFIALASSALIGGALIFKKPTSGNPGTSDKMKGVLAEIKTYNEAGKVLDDKIVFEPYCEWYTEQFNDKYAGTRYELQEAIDKFGDDAIVKVVKEGKVIEVEKSVPEGLRKISCPKSEDFVKYSHRIYYPFPGAKNYLIRGPF